MHHDDFNFEPVPGLPEKLPEGEHILWQGQPNVFQLARDAWKMNWVLGYFAFLTFWRVGVSSASVPFLEALTHGLPFIVAGIISAGILYILAFAQARSTMYTLTNKRAAMRIGAALTMTLNLPYVQIGTAGVTANKKGFGTLAFELMDDTRISYIMPWPHTRPWHLKRTQPAFRAIPDAVHVAQIFAEAAETRVSEPKVTRVAPSTTNAIAAE
jgi:hypothetical protein